MSNKKTPCFFKAYNRIEVKNFDLYLGDEKFIKKIDKAIDFYDTIKEKFFKKEYIDSDYTYIFGKRLPSVIEIIVSKLSVFKMFIEDKTQDIVDYFDENKIMISYFHDSIPGYEEHNPEAYFNGDARDRCDCYDMANSHEAKILNLYLNNTQKKMAYLIAIIPEEMIKTCWTRLLSDYRILESKNKELQEMNARLKEENEHLKYAPYGYLEAKEHFEMLNQKSETI